MRHQAAAREQRQHFGTGQQQPHGEEASGRTWATKLGCFRKSGQRRCQPKGNDSTETTNIRITGRLCREPARRISDWRQRRRLKSALRLLDIAFQLFKAFANTPVHLVNCLGVRLGHHFRQFTHVGNRFLKRLLHHVGLLNDNIFRQVL